MTTTPHTIESLKIENSRIIEINNQMRQKIQALIERGSVIADAHYHNKGKVTKQQLDNWYGTLIWPPAYSIEESDAIIAERPALLKSNEKPIN